jgi:hypothetical protein
LASRSRGQSRRPHFRKPRSVSPRVRECVCASSAVAHDTIVALRCAPALVHHVFFHDCLLALLLLWRVEFLRASGSFCSACPSSSDSRPDERRQEPPGVRALGASPTSLLSPTVDASTAPAAPFDASDTPVAVRFPEQQLDQQASRPADEEQLDEVGKAMSSLRAGSGQVADAHGGRADLHIPTLGSLSGTMPT